MTKTETRHLLEPYFGGRLLRGKKTPEVRQIQALLLIGKIQEARSLASLLDEGNEVARMMAELCRHREAQLVQHLRKL